MNISQEIRFIEAKMGEGNRSPKRLKRLRHAMLAGRLDFLKSLLPPEPPPAKPDPLANIPSYVPPQGSYTPGRRSAKPALA